MLPEVGASELLVIAIVALIVVGPKDLPVLLRRLGQFMARVRGMAAEFRASFDEMARQSELDDLRREVEAMRKGQYADIAAQAGEVEMRDTFGDIEQGLSGYPYSPQPLTPLESPLLEISEAPPKPARKPRTRTAKAPAKGKAAVVKTPAAKPKAPRKPRAKAVETGS